MHANPYWLLVCDPSTQVPPLRQRPGEQAFLTTKKQTVLKVDEETEVQFTSIYMTVILREGWQQARKL